MPGVWWRTLGGTAAVAIAVGVTATGCAPKAKHQPSTLSRSASPATTTAASTPSPLTQAAAIGDPNAVLLPAPRPPAPRCPPLVRYAAGNAGPLFCTDGKDNPAALRYFTSLHLKIMQLPASAHQSQAITAICADLRRTSEGAEYSAYLLAANREHWYFIGIAKVHGKLHRLCQPSRPAPTPSPTPS